MIGKKYHSPSVKNRRFSPNIEGRENTVGKSFLVTSGKGGTGKTTVTAGIASCLAALSHRVVCVDADVGLRNLDIMLGLSDKAVLDFGDVLLGTAPLGDALYAHPDIPNLWLLSAPVGIAPRPLDASDFARMIAALTEGFDYCFVDSPAGLGSGFAMAAAACNSALLVSLLDLSSLRDASLTADALEQIGLSDVRLILNHVRPELVHDKKALNVDDAMDMVGLPLLGLVPEDVSVINAGNRGAPIILCEKTGAALACLDMARRLDGERVPLRGRYKARY